MTATNKIDIWPDPQPTTAGGTTGGITGHATTGSTSGSNFKLLSDIDFIGNSNSVIYGAIFAAIVLLLAT